MRIIIRSFDNPFFVFENHPFWGLTRDTRKIGLPESRVLYTVLRSPHIDKKSREQFEMERKKQFFVIKTETHELRNKFFRFKRQRIFGAQYEICLSCKTRSVRIRANSRDCFEVRSLPLPFPQP